MNLVKKFNDSYKASQGNDLVLGMYFAFNYGSNGFCFDQMERLKTSANDSGAPSMQQRILGL